MPLKIIRQDITKIKCDAIVNPTDPHYSHGGGVDAQVHEAAGAELYQACMEQGTLSVGNAIITSAFSLPCKHVIHTVGPVWKDGHHGEENDLRSCYSECLKLALKNKCKSMAIPLIASGTFGFPKDRVLRIAMDAIGEFLLDHEMRVYIVVYDKEATAISLQLFADVQMFIDDNYVDRRYSFPSAASKRCTGMPDDEMENSFSIGMGIDTLLESGRTIEDLLNQIDESFSEMLLRKIDESGMTDAECYKKANIDRKLFSKIRSDKEYRPSKNTVLAFAIALKLPLYETQDMLAKEKDGKIYVSTVLFDNESEVVHDRVEIGEIKPMTREDYQVGGCTALLDAVGGAIHHIGNIHKHARPEDVPEHTIFIITTDGMENASHRYDSRTVKAQIERQREKYGWEFIFLAANIDAVETAENIGIRRERAANYRQDAKGVGITYEAMSEAIMTVRQGGTLDDACWRKKIDKDNKGGKRK